MSSTVNPMVFRKQFELFKIPEYYTYYIDYDRLSFYLDQIQKSKLIIDTSLHNGYFLIILLEFHLYNV